MLRLKHSSGAIVKKGTYWSFSTGERVTLKTGGVLPGDGTTAYYKAHPVIVLLAAPVLGLVYAVFLPFIGIATVITMAARKLFGEKLHEMSKLANFGWRPAEAYFAGDKAGKAERASGGEHGAADVE